MFVASWATEPVGCYRDDPSWKETDLASWMNPYPSYNMTQQLCISLCTKEVRLKVSCN